MHAAIQATLYNAHFENHGTPWTAEDLLGRGDREKRKAERFKDKMATFRVQQASEQANDEMPEWARQLSFNRKKVN
jgi:hypothetical protein